MALALSQQAVEAAARQGIEALGDKDDATAIF
jgi:hypothetical protein